MAAVLCDDHVTHMDFGALGEVMVLCTRVTSVASKAILLRIVLRERLVVHNNINRQAAKARKMAAMAREKGRKTAKINSTVSGPHQCSVSRNLHSVGEGEDYEKAGDEGGEDGLEGLKLGKLMLEGCSEFYRGPTVA